MFCQEEKCESDRGIPFLILRKDKPTATPTAERRVLCPTCAKTFRRDHRKQIRTGEIALDALFNANDCRSVMHEFSGRPLRRGRL